MADGSENGICSIHKMPLDQDCVTHKTQICSGCNIVEHSTCQKVEPQIPLQSFVSAVSRVCELLDCQLNMLGEEKQTADNLVKETCRTYKEKIDKLEQRSLQDIENGFHKQTTQLQGLIEKLRSSMNVKSDVQEVENTTNEILRSCLISKLTAKERDPQFTVLSKIAEDFLRRETPSYLLKFQISETFDEVISQHENVGRILLCNLMKDDQVSEKEQISMKDFEQSLPRQPTAPLQSDPVSPPSYEEIIQRQDKVGTVGFNSPFMSNTSIQPHDAAIPTPSPVNYGGVYPPMPSPQQGFGCDNTSGQNFLGPYKDLSMGRETYDQPFQQSIVKQCEGPAVLKNFRKAPSGPPKKLKFLSNINPRRMDENEPVEISGITFLANGNIVITDKANLKLKIYDDMKVLRWQRILDSKPYDVTQAPTGDIAVASPKEHRVNFFRSHNLSPVLNAVVTNPDSKCFGLTSSDEYLFVTWKESNGSESIRIYNEQYSELRKLSIPAERSMAVDPTTLDLFYRVLNFGNDQIKCTNAFSDAKTKWKIKIQDPLIEGMALLKSGILVSSYSGVSFVDFRDHSFTSLLKLKDASHLSVNRDRSKVAMVINECSLTDDKNDVLQLYDIIY
ncbi:uncharacterized protein LOC133193642 [Saccostrea echinata]|uniref:uncharacterized protein LOC133193642 n=1 Tax=Saccostrea echinata TaxID=191078 RepID=UPI002A7EF43C|nr:uncharacterized protein LOC133193642 [Saccostrea echinata]